MWYEINVSKNGRHFFATAERSLDCFSHMEKAYLIFKEKFPEKEGYKITITFKGRKKLVSLI